MKKIISLILVAVMLISCVTVLSSCQNNDSESVVTLDINPSIELVVDKDNKVTAVYGSNEDAKILLSAYADIEGKDALEATEKIVELAVDLGYISEDNKVVGTTVNSTNEKTEEKLNKNIKVAISNSAKNCGLEISTTDGFFFSIQRKYDNFKKENPDSKITLAEFKLAFSAADTGLVTLDTAVTMDKEQLIEIISNHHKTVTAYTTKAFEDTRAAANLAYEKAAGSINDAIYMNFYAKHMLNHRENFYYGALYMMYKSSARILEASAYIADEISRIYDTELSEEQIQKVMKVLNLSEENIYLIQNADKTVTIRSVESYVDTLIKNEINKEHAKEISIKVSGIITDIEIEINTKINTDLEKESLNCLNFVENSKKVLAIIEPNIPKSAKGSFDKFVSDYDAITSKIDELKADGTFSPEDIRTVAALFDEKCLELEKNINLDLSKEELAEIETAKSTAKAKLDQLKAEFDKKVNDAETAAKQYIDSAKDARLEKYGLK